jgi:hypothetical protein
MPVIPPIYCNEVDELIAFPNHKTALEWLKNNQLDTSGTSILVPFKDENAQIKFIRPSAINNSVATKDSNNNLRIMGAANSSHTHGLFNWFEDKLTTNRVPHLNELVGDNISLVEHGFIVIYEKGEKKVGRQFATLFTEEKQSLIDKIKSAQTNEEPHIKEAEFLEKLSQLALDLDIKVGMNYFVTFDKDSNQHVYRQTFKQDPTNKNIEKYLQAEAKWHESKRVKIRENKSQDHHIIRFLIDWCKWTVFAAISAIGAGLILGLFISPPIGTIAAAIIAVVTFVGMSSIGFAKADKNNPATIIYGTTEFTEESEVTFFSRIKQRISSLHNLFGKKPNKTAALSTKNNDNGAYPSPIGIFTTVVTSNNVIPVLDTISMPSITALVNSSLSLSTFQQENEFKSNALSFRN